MKAKCQRRVVGINDVVEGMLLGDSVSRGIWCTFKYLKLRRLGKEARRRSEYCTERRRFGLCAPACRCRADKWTLRAVKAFAFGRGGIRGRQSRDLFLLWDYSYDPEEGQLPGTQICGRPTFIILSSFHLVLPTSHDIMCRTASCLPPPSLPCPRHGDQWECCWLLIYVRQRLNEFPSHQTLSHKARSK